MSRQPLRPFWDFRSRLAEDKKALLTSTCHNWNLKNTTTRSHFYREDGDGHRVAHCPCWEDGYILREVRPEDANTVATFQKETEEGLF